ncbi:TetR/AcrR family transcriptional regulator [Microbacterium phyllosphaerae]|uniref:TetR/AcrR family transcriptional regulator n=1 Tax=Microbacterium phyllosphaerae TaxID=124798 RepID=UPI000EA02054|nr:TetR/AcrR family transcriptional regulator [Microbacterium phyllosphaerae]
MTDTAVTKPRGPYAKTAKVRERILDAGVGAFSETGYHATTIKEIAERAGISERGLVHHFPNKAELLGAILERRESQNQGIVVEKAGLAALLEMLEVVSSDRQTPGLVELHTIISAEAASPDHPGHEHYRFRYDMIRLFATQSFAAVRAAGLLESRLSDEELGASFVALSDGLQLQWLYNSDSVDPATLLRRFLQSVIPSTP